MNDYNDYYRKHNSHNRLTVRKAAYLMEVSENFIKEGLKDERLPFGYAVNIGGNKWTYFISKNKFTESTGIEIED